MVPNMSKTTIVRPIYQPMADGQEHCPNVYLILYNSATVLGKFVERAMFYNFFKLKYPIKVTCG